MVFWIAVGTVVIMAGWSITAATYFAFRDDVLRTLIARQADQQFAYEDRIAELRAQIDRTTSRQLLDQEQFEQKLDDLMRRQATLEQRATRFRRHRRPGDDRLDQVAAQSRSATHPRRRAPTVADSPTSARRSVGSKLRSTASKNGNRSRSANGRPLRRQGPPNTRRPHPARDQGRCRAGGSRRPVCTGKTAGGK